ncbi:MAG: hypothetical protein J0L84_00265 [Verrucomicrobia bacterium]|nr:hypothetical protein [Verrucomicrobiota bacterium]
MTPASRPAGNLDSEPDAGSPVTFGDGVGLGLGLLALATAGHCALEAGTPEFWPDALGFGLWTAALGLLVVWPAYLLYVAVAHGILTRFRCSVVTHRRWRIWPPALVLAAAFVNQASNLRPSVAFRTATGRQPPASLAQFHRCRGSGLMWSRDIVWFECAPSDLQELIQSSWLIPATNAELQSLMDSDPHLRARPIRDRLSEVNASVGYQRASNVLNFSLSELLIATPKHDRAVWIRRQDR